jgi:outer membrane protein assembly factor BamE (lipoprotein component of BamABCDE complex)
MSPRALLTILAVLPAVAATGACAPMRGFNGYVVDRDLLAGVQPGIDNRDSVLRTLGKPTFQSQFDGGDDWYYVSRNTGQVAFRTPRATAASNVRVRFDKAGNVTAVDRTGLEQVASINPSDKKTPTLGRERSFFEEIFGGIGQVGSGLGGSAAPTNTGGQP